MIKYFTKHPTAANLLMCVFLMLGLLTMQKIKREAMPDHTTRTLQITAVYPGATAEEIEEAVALPIEEALDNVNNIKRIKTTAMEGAVSVQVEMMDAADYQTFYNDIKREVDAITTFPDLLEDLNITPRQPTDQVVGLAVYGDLSVVDLKAYCENIKDKLDDIGNGINVAISGFSQHEFRIELSPSVLHTYKLSVNQIADIISEQNIDLPAGTLETGTQDIKLRFSDRRKTIQSLADVKIIYGSRGGELKLGDIATITDRFSEDENKVLFNGQRAGIINVSKSKNADSLTIYKQVMKIVDQEKAEAPKGMRFEITRDMASEIKDRLNMVYINALQGFLLVFGALWLFLNIKLSFWVAMGLPISFLGGLFVMHCLGVSLNMVSTFALIIAIGLLMDDAIVIAENIAVHLHKGDSPTAAAIAGVKEVGNGVVSSFLTTICIFTPLIFLEGQIGKILCVIPLTLIIILSVSLIEAFFIMPNHLAHSFKNGLPEPNLCRKKIDSVIDYIRFKFLRHCLDFILPYRYLFLSLILGLFIFSLSMFPAGYLKFRVFPDIDGDIVVCKVALPPGSPLEQSEKVARQICDAAEKMNEQLTPEQPDGKKLVKFISVNFSENSDSNDSGAHLFTVYIDLLPGNERTSNVAEIVNIWREKTGTIPGLSSIRFTKMEMGPGGKAVEVRLQSKSLANLKSASAMLREKLATYDGVHDISDNLTPGKPELVMSLRSGAMKLGLNAFAIAEQLRSAYQGKKADELQIGSENYEFNVRLSHVLKENLNNFDNFQLTTPNGKKVPLLNIVEIKEARGLSAINRYNRKRTVTVSASLNNALANASEVTFDLQKNYLPKLKKLFPDVNCSFGGQREAGGETGGSMSNTVIIGIAGIFILLSLQFGKFLEPLIVMGTIPLAIIGVIWGHIFVGKSFDMQGLIGVISLSGIVVNDSILMIEFIKKEERSGKSAFESACSAVSLRFRALMLTSLTTIVGLLPILTEKSIQAQMIIPMALSIVCGLSTSTFLELFVIPALYMVVQDFRNRVNFHKVKTV